MATSKKIIMGDVSFSAEDEGKILANPNPEIISSISPVLLDLPWDVMEFGIRSEQTGEKFILDIDREFLATDSDERLYIDEGNLLNTEQGTQIEAYDGEDLLDKFYLKDIKAGKNNEFRITAQSIVGILEGQAYMGGFYVSELFPDVIDDILGAGITYTIADELQTARISGALGIMSKRRALSAVLLATGASAMKDANGDLVFKYNLQTDARPIGPIGMGGDRLAYQRATKVSVTEHSFFASAEQTEEVLFDNTNETNVTNYVIYFDEPNESYRADGITLVDSGAYWAKLTGVGVLYGKPYVHVRREISESTGVSGPLNEIRVSDCTLINPANATNVLERIKEYEATVQISEIEALVTDERAGDLVQYEDPYDGESTGYIISLDKTMSNQDKATLKIAKDWTPGPFGNAYDSYIIVKGSDLTGGIWSVPAAVKNKDILVDLFSGAEGGQGGYAGESPGLTSGYGTPYTYYEYEAGFQYERYMVGAPSLIQAGGRGGRGGAGGAAASKFLRINTNISANSCYVSFGSGGAGGAGGTPDTDPELGAAGGDSTFRPANVGTAFSTADGVVFRGTYLNLITGEVIAETGDQGGSGADGGAGGQGLQFSNTYAQDYAYTTQGKGQAGGSVGTYTGGAGANGIRGLAARIGTTYQWVANGGGGGGGGAAMGANGSAGTVPAPYNASRGARTHTSYDTDYMVTTNNIFFPDGGDPVYTGALGGNGGSASIVPAQPIYKGGTGGYGGGGGGGAGQSFGQLTETYADGDIRNCGVTRGGIGGNGGQGGQGSDGFMIVYYKAS